MKLPCRAVKFAPDGASEIFDESNVKLRQGAVKEIAKRFEFKVVR